MKLSHFDALRPICPLCVQRGAQSELGLVVRERGSETEVEFGVLRCRDGACDSEYPIMWGIPIVVPNAAEFVGANVQGLVAPEDFPPLASALLGECAGPGSAFDAARQHISSYAWDHYGEDATSVFDISPGCAARVVDTAAAAGGVSATGNTLELGCGVGGAALRLATHADGLVLGIDLHIPMLRMARRVLATGAAEYDLRTSGFLYRRVRRNVDVSDGNRIDLWCCDATCLPFGPGAFSTVVGLNILDCVPSPLDLLMNTERVLAPGGRFALCTPYDWSPNVTQPAAWIGGHSPRGYFGGDPAAILEAILTPEAHAVSMEHLVMRAARNNLPWHVRTHDRGLMQYRLHLVAGERV